MCAGGGAEESPVMFHNRPRRLRRGQTQTKSCRGSVFGTRHCAPGREGQSAPAVEAGGGVQTRDDPLNLPWRNRMRTRFASFASMVCGPAKTLAAVVMMMAVSAAGALAQNAPEAAGGEASLKLPDLSQVSFLGVDGHKLLMIGILFCVAGLLFGLAIYTRLKHLPVHRSMLEISELIYETCKTYLITQGKFILILEAFIAVIIILYFGVLQNY